MRWRLSLMMFVLYAAPGAFVPVFSRRLDQLGFTPDEIGRSSATQALAGLVGPLVVGQIADRWLPPERCLTVCAAASAGLLWLLAGLTGPWPVFFAALAAWLFLGPTMTLSTVITLGHITDPESQFGRIRLWGTVGWVAPAPVLWLWLEPAMPWNASAGGPRDLSDCVRLAAVCSLILAFYSLTLPTAGRRLRPTSWLAPLAAAKLLRNRSFAVYVLGSAGLCLTLAVATQGIPLLFKGLGVPDPLIPVAMTVAQSTEVVTLFLLPMLLLRLEMRGTMLLGFVAWLAGMIVFAAGGPLPLVLAMLGSWGVMICCYIVAGQVFVNSHARGDIRASAQALLTCTNAIGQVAGNLLAGWIRGLNGGDLGLTFGVAAGIVAVLLGVFLVGFQARSNGSSG